MQSKETIVQPKGKILVPPRGTHLTVLRFPGGSEGEESACNIGDSGSIPGSGRSPEEGNGNPSQNSWLENSVDSPWGCKELDTTECAKHWLCKSF